MTPTEAIQDLREHTPLSDRKYEAVAEVIERLVAELAQSKEDTARLDWLLSDHADDGDGWRGIPGTIYAMQSTYAAEDGAFKGWKQIKSRVDIDAARQSKTPAP